jgi:hemerythrin-like domain-containing protein
VCEYCGCQSIHVIADLTSEHELVVNLIGDVRAAADAGDTLAVAGVARQIAAVLGPHTAVEEQGLFPALAGDFGAQIAVLEAEHRHIEAVLGEAAAGVPADPAWPGRLLAVLHLLRDHILKEQDGVFPAALATLHTDEWEAAEEVRSRVGVHLPHPAR